MHCRLYPHIGKLENGVEFDSSSGGDPMSFKLGEGKVITGFEEAVVGMKPGQTKTVVIPAEKAYGSRREDRMLEIDRAGLSDDAEITVGQRLQVPHPQGGSVTVTVAVPSPSPTE